MPNQAEALHQEPATIAPRPDFSSLEWLVISIGARDGSVSLYWSPLGESLLKLFGMQTRPQRLGSPCLEALRHMAALTRRHGWGVPAAEIGAFFKAGWSEDQLELLIESVSHDEPLLDDAAPALRAGGIPAREDAVTGPSLIAASR